MKYIIMVCVLLHNICIARNDPGNARWYNTPLMSCILSEETFIAAKTRNNRSKVQRG